MNQPGEEGATNNSCPTPLPEQVVGGGKEPTSAPPGFAGTPAPVESAQCISHEVDVTHPLVDPKTGAEFRSSETEFEPPNANPSLRSCQTGGVRNSPSSKPNFTDVDIPLPPLCAENEFCPQFRAPEPPSPTETTREPPSAGDVQAGSCCPLVDGNSCVVAGQDSGLSDSTDDRLVDGSGNGSVESGEQGNPEPDGVRTKKVESDLPAPCNSGEETGRPQVVSEGGSSGTERVEIVGGEVGLLETTASGLYTSKESGCLQDVCKLLVSGGGIDEKNDQNIESEIKVQERTAVTGELPSDLPSVVVDKAKAGHLQKGDLVSGSVCASVCLQVGEECKDPLAERKEVVCDLISSVSGDKVLESEKSVDSIDNQVSTVDSVLEGSNPTVTNPSPAGGEDLLAASSVVDNGDSVSAIVTPISENPDDIVVKTQIVEVVGDALCDSSVSALVDEVPSESGNATESNSEAIAERAIPQSLDGILSTDSAATGTTPDSPTVVNAEDSNSDSSPSHTYEEIEFDSGSIVEKSSAVNSTEVTAPSGDMGGNNSTCSSDLASSSFVQVSGRSNWDLPLSTNNNNNNNNNQRRSLVDDVMYEVERVQRQHEQGLRELNLDMENLLLSTVPTPGSGNSVAASGTGSATTSGTAYAHRELPSLPTVSADDRKNQSTSSPRVALRREMSSALKMEPVVTSTPLSKRRGWIRLPSLSGGKDKPTPVESYSKVRESAVDEPVYMLYDDSHRQDGGYYRDLNGQQSSSSTYSDDGIYEDIERSLTGPAYRRVPKTPMNSHRRDHMNGSGGGGDCYDEDFEEFEPYDDPGSDTESEKSFGRVSLASIKNTLRNVTRRMSRIREDSNGNGKEKEAIMPGNDKRQTLFPWRKEYDLEKNNESIKAKSSQPQDDVGLVRMQLQPPTLPPMPAGLSNDQMKRRCIVSTLVHSENAYVATLKRLLHDYKKPLEDSHPPILSKNKTDTLFYRVAEIQQCHAMFRIALTDCVRRWDKEEKIGDVFIASFSKAMVLDMYSGFINNFSAAMELAKQESKRKSAFADFLKVKQITSPDRLSFFGLMVKPVQRFPQFILLLQDLLKQTPHEHHDRMNLQLALTQLESLAEMLNERKRESEQHHAVKELMRHVTAKFSPKCIMDSGRQHFLLRQDNFTQLKFDQDGQISKTKERRLYLLNELLVCVSVSLASPNSLNSNERYSLKWAVPVSDVDVQLELSPNLNRLLSGGLNKSGNRNSRSSPGSNANAAGIDNAQALYQEMSDLMHDYEVLGRISALIATLKRNYVGLTTELIQSHSQTIMQTIQEKDEEVKWIDNCCLQLNIPIKNKNSKELVTFQTHGPTITKEWITELRMAQLALDSNNSPSWDIPDHVLRPSTKMPLFVQALPAHSASYPSEVKSACYYSCPGKPPSSKLHHFLWACSSDGVNSHISIFSLQQVNVRKISSFDLAEVRISTMEAVPPKGIDMTSMTTMSSNKLKGWTVWMGTDSRRIVVFSGSEPDRHENLGYVSVAAPVLHLRYYCDQLFAALACGSVVIFRRSESNGWSLKDNTVVNLSTEPVTSLLPYNNSMYCACGRKVWLLDCATGEVTKNFSVHHEQLGNVYLLAQSGIGLWINLRNTSTICLYHMETFKHLQDINIAANINRVMADKDHASSPRCIFVTSLLACRGLLWVGTNVGVTLTVTLPRLEGVPIISGRASMSYHMLAGPVTTLVALTSPIVTPVISAQIKEEKPSMHTKLSKQVSCSVASGTAKVSVPLRAQFSSPSLFNAQKPEPSPPPQPKLLTHTKATASNGNEGDYDVYGLYGDLLNVREYFDEGGVSESILYEPLRRSEPDLLLPTAVSTLDRRLRMKAGRPKSLDLANLSASEPVYMSSSSDGGSSTASSSAVSIAESLNSAVSHVPLRPSTLPGQGLVKAGPPVNQPVPTEAPRTILTIMGGRGYRNMREKPTKEKMNDPTWHNDAYILFWEMKL